VHGTLDATIPIEWGRAARDMLEEAGAAVSYLESPTGHSIDPAAIALLREVAAA